MKKYIISTWLFISIFVGSECFATNWYVDNAAGGTNAGTSWTNAWTSFAGIVWGGAGVKAGDTLYISGGTVSKTYNATLTVGASGTSGNIITIKKGIDSGHNGTVIIDGQSTRNNGIIIGAHPYVTIDGFELKNFVGANGTGAIDGSSASANYITITNCSIHDNGDSGVDGGVYVHAPTGIGLYAAGSYWVVTHNTFYNNYNIQVSHSTIASHNEYAYNTFMDKSAWAIVPSSSYLDLHDNTFIDCGKFYLPFPPHVNCIWIFLNDNNMTSHDTKIYNNLIYMTGTYNYPTESMTAAIQIAANYVETNMAYDGIYIYNNTLVNIPAFTAIALSSKNVSMSNVGIYNNSIYQPIYPAGTNVGAIGIFGGTGGSLPYYQAYTNVNIKGNVLKVGNSLAILVPYDNFTNMVIDYNNYYSLNSEPFIAGTPVTNHFYNWSNWQAVGYDTHGKGPQSDPLYVDASTTTHNLHLGIGSPCMDAFPTAQAPTSLFTTDIDGTTRPVGSAWDMGAYEYTSGTSRPAPPTNLRIQ